MPKDTNISHLKLLVNLAWVDSYISDKERGYILNIADSLQIDKSIVQKLLDNPPHEVELPGSFSLEKKEEMLNSLIQLMRIDDHLNSPEVRYCMSIAERLGYDRKHINQLLVSSQ